MEKQIDLLMQLGLSQYESKCYVALLGDFPAKPYQIGKTAGIPSAKIYEVISRLEQKGLIAEISGEEKTYVPKDPDIAIREWREQYLHVLKEAREALMDAVPLLGQALAVENRLPEPQEARDALSAPLASLWGAALESLRKFVEQPEAPIIPTLEALESSGLNWQLRRSNGSA